MGPTKWLIGCDTGGTFTDFVMFRPDRPDLALVTLKLSSTPDDPSRAVLEGLRTLTATLGGDGKTGPKDGAAQVGELCHATTVATNSLLERDVANVGFVTTLGFADSLWLGRGDRQDLFALRPLRRPPPLDRAHVWEVKERVKADGVVTTALSDSEVQSLIDGIHRSIHSPTESTADGPSVQAIAVCLLHSPLNPDHEERLNQALETLGLPVFLSHLVSPTSGEYERGMTTLVSAALAPKVSAYLRQIKKALGSNALWVVHSAGGLLTASEAREAPHRLALSGPAAGLRGALNLGESCGQSNLITLDMGGTSSDVALCHQGELPYLWETQIDELPLRSPTLEIHTIGAGGGSIAHKDGGGFLRVGPRSAGAVPGPACYQRGGTQPTVTDALCWAGYLPETLGDAELPLDPHSARQSLQNLGRELGLGIDETAIGILAVAVSHLGLAVRKVSTGRGYDPKAFTLLPFGGAGPLLCCSVAEALEMNRILVPRSAGVLSAWGALVAPWEREWSAAVPAEERCDENAWRSRLQDLASQMSDVDVNFSRQALVARRYRGQGETLVSSPDVDFHKLHLDRFGFSRAGHLVETVEVRWRCRGPQRLLPTSTQDTLDTPWTLAAKGHSLLVSPDERIEVQSFQGRLAPGQTQKGPFLTFSSSSTLYVSSEWEAVGQGAGDILLRRRDAQVYPQ